MKDLLTAESLWAFYDNIKGDLKYAGLLVFCTLLSLLLRTTASRTFRVHFDGIIGLLITTWISGWCFLYSFIAVIAHLLLYRFVIGLSYEVADSRSGKSDALKRINEPSFFQAFNYLYSYTGLFTGPYYTYRTYSDAYELSFCAHVPEVLNLVKGKLTTLSWSLPLLILMNVFAPVKILRTEESGEYNLFYLFILTTLAFVYLRMRIYSAWMVAEAICIISGIGVYDHSYHCKPGLGPSREPADGEAGRGYDSMTIDNLDIPHVESSDGFRSGMRAWNRTVQFWLAHFVYKRAPKMPWTMFISAFWHGVHPGYFLSFLTVPLCTSAEDAMFKRFPEMDGERNQVFARIWRFIRMRGFEMMASGFLLLTWTDTIRLWKRQFFWLHWLMIALLICHNVIPKPSKTRVAKKPETAEPPENADDKWAEEVESEEKELKDVSEKKEL